MARRSAPTRSRARAKSSAGPHPPFEVPADMLRRVAHGRRARQGRRARPGKQRLAALEPATRARVRAPHRAATCRRTSSPPRVRDAEGEARRRAEGDRDAQRLRDRARSRSTAAVPEMIGGSADLTGSNNTKRQGHGGARRRRLCRPLHPLRHPRARHGGGHERHGAAWRHHSLFRHLPGVLRLLPAGDPPRRADGRSASSM